MPSIRTAVAKVRWSVHHRGLLGTLRQAATSFALRGTHPPPLVSHPFDIAYGVETSGMVTAAQLASGEPNELLGTGYSGVPPSRFSFVMDRWMATPPEAPIGDYSFIDIGCGKGRALMLATRTPFRQIIGIELNRELTAVASANLETWRAANPDSPPVRVECCDATRFQLPETPCLLYLYNPFAEPILKVLLDNVAASLAANPRPLDILYCNPESIRPFQKSQHFVELWSGPLPISEEDAAAQPFAAGNEICHLFRWRPAVAA